MPTYLPDDILDRLANKFAVGDGCWEWTASPSARYGRVSIGHQQERLAHRVMYELMVGPIPGGYDVDHLCRNTRCVRPDHLEAVTHQENCRRGIANYPKARENAAKTHCPQGHPYSEENTYRWGDGSRRVCKKCHRAKTAAQQRGG